PEQGGTAGRFQFSPEEAYQAALTDINDFPGYLARNPEAFFHLGNYTQNGDQGRWEMTFGEDGSSEHYWIEARMPSGTVEITDNDEQTDDTLPLSSRSDIGEVVTLSRGSRLLRAEPEIGALCFNGPNVDWTKYTFNVTEGVSTISLDPTSVLVGSQETGYVYMLVGRTGPVQHRAALDATNGQVLFTWKHIETWDFLEITL
ncbi:MAG: hypothetical protein GWN18_00515, partial [Thermoplasmata archaeon]|nr:hypothetical protein [Thermoplasmata archaeon]NIS11774.1 hypothetical protein [Thermoplasmata archaeon]NIS18438.1 hypothetical protein [Thermoplasmata archaeon]NIT75427.1 hypothetical protein [Thermoplasmata archaeon]NIU47594.1 hypothetical protein [Thermoplasmata archaeon]